MNKQVSRCFDQIINLDECYDDTMKVRENNVNNNND